MFKVGNLKIKFRYDDYEITTSYGEQAIVRLTWCEIYEVDEHSETPLIKASVNCYYKDIYSKMVGRKRALESALEYLKNIGGLSKEKRTEIWNRYFELSPKSKYV